MKVDFFQAVSLFSQASLGSLKKLSQITRQRFYRKGRIILSHQQARLFFLYVVSGWIKVFKESSDGKEIIVDVMSQHSYCGESFLFDTEKDESYSVQAISDIEVLTIPIPNLKEVVLTDHPLSLSFLKSALKKQRRLNMEVEHLAIQNAAQRIGCFLLRLCGNPGTKKGIKLRLPYDKSLLASHLGMRSETFSRALAHLRDQYGVYINGECVDITSIDRLTREVCQHCSLTFPCNSVKRGESKRVDQLDSP